MSQPSFRFKVEEIFWIKPPVDRVILVGTVIDGMVLVGDSGVLNSQTGPVSVVVEGIETINQGDVQRAGKGQQVGLRVRGIDKETPSKGDRVIGDQRRE